MNFRIIYDVHLKNGGVLRRKEIIVKNKELPLVAQVSLEGYLRKKYADFDKLIVHSCNEDSDIFKMFNDIFKR